MITALSADALVFGTPTINRNAVKPVWDIISSIDLVNMKNVSCFVFGSYGWGGEGIQLVNHLELLKLKPLKSCSVVYSIRQTKNLLNLKIIKEICGNDIKKKSRVARYDSAFCI